MLKIFKQEMLFIPIFLVLIEIFRNGIVHFYPDTALFDRGSELETFLFRTWQMVWITSAVWIIMAVAFPAAYRSLKRFYTDYHNMDEILQRNYSFKIFLIFFFGLIMLISGRAANSESIIRANLIDTLHSQLNVRELTGNNDGYEVERYLNYVSAAKGAPWCAAFVSWNLNAVGISSPPNPKSAWSPNFSKMPYVVYHAKEPNKGKGSYKMSPGDCFTLYYQTLGRVGHVGFIVSKQSGYFITIEGNTAAGGTREGSGVHKMKRSADKVYTITNYITKYANENFKTSLPFTVPDNGKLLPKNSISYRANKGLNHYCKTNKRLFDCSRFNYKNSYRQCKDNSIRGQHGEFASNCDRKQPNPIEFRNKERRGNRGMLLQGVRAKGSALRAENNGIALCQSKTSTFKIRSKGFARAICAQMGKGSCLDRRNMYSCNYHIYSC